jgi:hypothetical protein
MAGDEDQKHHRGELILGEPVLAVTSRHQRGDQIVGRDRALGLNQLPKVAHHCGGCRDEFVRAGQHAG